MCTPASQILGGDFELTFELMRKDYEIFSSINIRTRFLTQCKHF